MSARGIRRDRERTRSREARRSRKLALGASAAMGAAAFAAPAADAASFTVTSNADDGSPGTLRDAVDDANANAFVPDDIFFASNVTGQITLLSGELNITDAVHIHGPGANVLTVSGNNNGRVIDIDLGPQIRQTRSVISPYVTISGLSVADGYLYQANGAGIRNVDASLTVEDSAIYENEIVTYSPFTGHGAGIASEGPLTLSNSEVSFNAIYGALSGGDRRGANGLGGLGGGVDLLDNATISNSTISGNGAALGGGMSVDEEVATVDIRNSTIADNYAKYAGGGIYRKYNPSDPASTNLISTIVGDNNAQFDGPDLYEQDSSATSRYTAAFSLVETPDDHTLAQTGPNVLGQDPQLADLAPNGGPTETQLPAATSPAIDQGISNGLTTDQRGSGFARTGDNAAIANAAGGDGTDIGAVELQVAATTPPAQTKPVTRECLGVTATIVGTTGKDVITGTDGRDVIRGLRGNDVIKSLQGDDLVCGDKGVDKIRSGDGSDTVRGGNNGDNIRGGDGNDTLRGGSGIDRIFGEGGDDQLFGGAPQGKPAKGLGGGGPGNVCDGGPGTDSADGCETERDVP